MSVPKMEVECVGGPADGMKLQIWAKAVDGHQIRFLYFSGSTVEVVYTLRTRPDGKRVLK